MPEAKDLQGYRIFEDLDDEELKALAPLAREGTREPGERIITEGEPATHLYLVKEGKVLVKMTSSSERDVVVDEVGPGMSAGWSALTKRRISTASVDVAEPSVLIAFEGDSLRRLFEDNSRLGYRVMNGVNGVVSRRLERWRTQFAARQ